MKGLHVLFSRAADVCESHSSAFILVTHPHTTHDTHTRSEKMTPFCWTFPKVIPLFAFVSVSSAAKLQRNRNTPNAKCIYIIRLQLYLPQLCLFCLNSHASIYAPPKWSDWGNWHISFSYILCFEHVPPCFSRQYVSEFVHNDSHLIDAWADS